ncbi:MAG: hypothetical protein ACRDH9_05635 [Actinomycetota bacterium]
MTRLRLVPTAGAVLLLTAALIPAAGAAPVVPVSTNAGCDPLDPSMCLFPFPNDYFTVADPATDTGRRVNFSPLAMPRGGTEVTEGGEGKPVDPTEWNRNDGFSPGSLILTHVPGLDLHATWGTADRAHSTVGPNTTGYFDYRDQITDIGLSTQEGAPIVLLNTETGAQHPFWSELDTQPAAIAGGEQALMIRPAANLEEGTRYIVALRNMKRADGSILEPRPEFAAYRSGTGADPARQLYYTEKIFPPLQAAGITHTDLYLAWDFTVASERNLSERILHMRDLAFAGLGDTNLADGLVQGGSPTFVVDRVEDRTDSWTDSRGVGHQQAIRRVRGRVTVPNFMDRIQQTEAHVKENEDTDPVVGERAPLDLPAPGSRLLYLDGDGLPDQNPAEPTINASFVCDVPLDGPRFPMLYGHGLLGDRYQVGDLKSPRRDGPFMGCAADWWGMSTPDIPTVASILVDGSNFPSLPDRAQQGFLNFMFLGRALVHPDGFASDPAFRLDGSPLIQLGDPDGRAKLFYDGNSQGGIMGGSLVAVSPDIHRAILGVVGMNYSTLLQRSVDWEDPYAIPFYEVYRDPMERQLLFNLMQMLWDRGEANGFAAHMTDDPFKNTPSHEVLLQVAYGDHQVANVSAEVEARTIGAPIMLPGLPAGRHWAPGYFGGTASYPYRGSSLVYWDSGNASPPNGNIAPTHSSDPHSHPRNEPSSSWQEAQFLLTGWMVDVCGGGPYLTLRNPINNGTPSCHEPEWEPGSRDF